MTLLHTKGYSEVLESVKMRAQKKAGQLARMPVTIEFTASLRKLPNIAVTQLTLACDDVNEEMAGSLMVEEDEELMAVFAEDFIHHYRFELDQIRSERVSEQESQPAPQTFGRCIKHRNPTCEECPF
jgi:hypothetical protein